jgi:hypothetical protein
VSADAAQRLFRAPIGIDATVEEFKALHPGTAVTMAGKNHIKGAIQIGNSCFKVTREFGEFVRQKIDAWVAPKQSAG